MKIQGVKGTRDFYPPEMAKRNRIVDGWKKVSIRNGFEEYDGPIFEYLQLYQIKSGDEIAEQLFSLTDRGGRDLAIRPEITPTLARMVNEQINSLPRPIKWFSVPRLCRAERPQRGRLREFFQWNIDIIGVDDVLADAEVIFCGLDYLLNEANLPAGDVVVKISNRKLLHAILTSYGVKDEQLDTIYGVLDKKSKLPPEAFEEMTCEKIADQEIAGKVIVLSKMSNDEVWQQYITPNLDKDNEFSRAAKEMDRLFEYLKVMGIPESAFEFDMGIIRGLAYYTGVVFEFYDKAGEMRAIGGGGRYDNLLELLGGPKISATGLGMGDVVLGIMLEEKGLLKPEMLNRRMDYYVAYTDKELLPRAIEITAGLRQKGFAVDMSYKGGNLGKQLKAATAANAAKCIIIGEELTKCNEIIIKDLGTGEQTAMAANSFER
jgi:histidyl-tRNA synthetase